jgi:hypothetical protein
MLAISDHFVTSGTIYHRETRRITSRIMYASTRPGNSTCTPTPASHISTVHGFKQKTIIISYMTSEYIYIKNSRAFALFFILTDFSSACIRDESLEFVLEDFGGSIFGFGKLIRSGSQPQVETGILFYCIGVQPHALHFRLHTKKRG